MFAATISSHGFRDVRPVSFDPGIVYLYVATRISSGRPKSAFANLQSALV